MRHLLLLMICAAASSPAAESRLVLLRQEGGFTLEFKNEGVSPLRVGETRLVLTLGAGAGRRELIAAQTFATDRTYQVEAEILPRRATIRVDGKLVGGVTVPFASGSGEIEVNIGEGEAIPVLNHLRVRTPVFTWDRPLPDAAPGLRLFAPAFPIAIGKAPLAPPIRIEAQVRFEPADPPGDLRTLLDRYGQLDAGTWLGKATEDEALRRKHLDEVAALERLLPPNPPAPTPASGAFRLVRQEARWNLISPEGDPMFFTGVRAVGETDATDWLLRRDGPEWRSKVEPDAERRLRALGFAGTYPLTSGTLPGIGVIRVPPNFDPFDPSTLADLRSKIEAQVAPFRRDPRLVGWVMTDDRRGVIGSADVVQILGDRADRPAKRALLVAVLAGQYDASAIKFATAYGGLPDQLARQAITVPEEDAEFFRLRYMEAYHAAVQKTLSAVDPDHLSFGFGPLIGTATKPEDWAIAARYCDVVGYELAGEYQAPPLGDSEKPYLCLGFAFPPSYEGARGFSIVPNAPLDDAQAGQRYADFAAAAARDPRCLGAIWHRYRDEPLLNADGQIDPGGRYAFGLVDGTDRLKMPLALAMRAANLSIAEARNRVPRGVR